MHNLCPAQAMNIRCGCGACFFASPTLSTSAAGPPPAPQAVSWGNMLFGARISSVFGLFWGHFWRELRKATVTNSYLRKTEVEREKARGGDMSLSLE